jgi:hypothetical protein
MLAIMFHVHTTLLNVVESVRRAWKTRKNHLEFDHNLTWKTWKTPGI